MYKYKILCSSELKQLQMWLNQYNTNTDGNMTIESPLTSFIKTDEDNKTYFQCIIKFKPWAGMKD